MMTKSSRKTAERPPTAAPNLVKIASMDPVLQLIIVMPSVILFALIVAGFMREENERFHSIEAAYRRRHTLHRTQAHFPVRSVRAQRPHEESVEAHHDSPVDHAA